MKQEQGRAPRGIALAVKVGALLALTTGGQALAQVVPVPASAETVAAALAEAPGEWAEAAVEVVVSRGLYIGYPDGTFGWRDDITRAEMAVVLARLIASFGLDALDPDSQALLREAVGNLDAELGGALEELARLRADLAAQGGRIEDLSAADAALAQQVAGLGGDVDDVQGRLTALELALATLRGVATGDELAALESELEGLSAGAAALAARLDALEAAAPAEADPSAEGLTELRDALWQLEARSAASEERLAAAEIAIDALAGTGAPGVDTTGLFEGLGRVTALQADVELRVDDTEERLDALEDRVDELAGRMDEALEALIPERGGFYVSLAVMGADPTSGILGRVAVGHDAVLDNIGFRVAYEHAFGPMASNASGAITYTAAMGRSDAYLGVGAGVAFEAAPVIFGEMLVGVQYRVARHLAVFVEGRYRPYFDGTNDQFGGVGGGVQFRF